MRREYDFSKGRRGKPHFNKSRRPKTFVFINTCSACDNKWQTDSRPYRCPACGYAVPPTKDSNLKIIETQRVNINKDGRIICHLVKS